MLNTASSSVLAVLAVVLLQARTVQAHGHITFPPSTRHGGSLATGGHCGEAQCMWFSQPTSIPGKPTLPDNMRTYNVHVTGGPKDWSATMPWRAPGTAPVLGSGCGSGGGGPVPLPNGGDVGPDWQGMDGVQLPKQEPTVWQPGSEQEVAFGITANHGGGYQYRLCKVGGDGGVSEECFQRTPLEFAGAVQWVQFDETQFQYTKMVQLPRFEMPLHKTSEGTHPAGSEWARMPIPGCRLCDQSVCGETLQPELKEVCNTTIFGGGESSVFGGCAWVEQQVCSQSCSGLNLTACPPGMTQFPEPLSGISGYTGSYEGEVGLPYSIVDRVRVPEHLEEGHYLLSWRWDCEQSNQIWQNCADIRVEVKKPDLLAARINKIDLPSRRSSLRDIADA